MENLFEITKYKNLTFVSNTVKSGYGMGASLGNIAIFQFHDVVPTNAFNSVVVVSPDFMNSNNFLSVTASKSTSSR